MIKVQTVPPEQIQLFDIEITFHYIRDLVEKCAQKLQKQNVKLYYDQQCNYEINSDLSLQEAQINLIIYAKVLENESESNSQYGDVTCWFRQDGIELGQGVLLRSDFTFEEVLDDAISKDIIKQMPKQIKVTNYRQTQILATLIEMQMFKLIDQKDKAPQLTIHFTTDDSEPQVEVTLFNQFPKIIPKFQGPKNVFQQTNSIQISQNFQQFQYHPPQPSSSQPPFLNQQQLPFQIQPTQSQFQQNNTQINQPQLNFSIQSKPQGFNDIQQSQQIFQPNIGQSGLITQNQPNKKFIQNLNLNKPYQGLQQQVNPPIFTPNQISSDKNPILTQPNFNNLLIPPDKNPIQNTTATKNPNMTNPNMTNPQQQIIFFQNLESDALKTIESMAQKSVESMISIGTFNFQINQLGTFVAYISINPKLSGYFLESRGKNMLVQNEKTLKWETKFGVSIAQKDNKGFIIKWKNNTYNSLSVNFM